MKFNKKISLTMAAIFIVLQAIVVTPVYAGGPELDRAEPIAIYQPWNWNYGEPGHDPDWVIRGRRNWDDDREKDWDNNGKGEENGNGNGLGSVFPDPEGEEIPEIFLIYMGETANSPESIYLKFLELLGEYLYPEK